MLSLRVLNLADTLTLIVFANAEFSDSMNSSIVTKLVINDT